ncbi:MAG: ERCC4 domain-containing protein [Candidatus Zixiibacteriota bacterium]
MFQQKKPDIRDVSEQREPGVKELTVIVDNAAAGSEVTQHLRGKDVNVVESYLKAGQYRVTDQCVIWHLTAEAFNALIADRTLYRRIPELKRTIPEPILIIEGDLLANLGKISQSTLRGALAFVTMHNRLPLLTAADAREVAEMVYIMANQGQKGMGLANSEDVRDPEITVETARDNPANGKNGGKGGNGHPPTDPAELQEYILRTIPNVTPAAARAMLKKFGSLRAICTASAKDLSPLEGIGPSKAKKIAGFLSWLRD